MWGERGSRQEKKSPPGAVTERETERERERRREGLWESFVKGGRGGAFLLLEFLGQLSSKTVASSGRKKGRKILHSRLSIITVWLSQPISFLSDHAVMNHLPLPVCANKQVFLLTNNTHWTAWTVLKAACFFHICCITCNKQAHRSGQLWYEVEKKLAPKEKPRLHRLRSHMMITKLLFKTVHICVHTWP